MKSRLANAIAIFAVLAALLALSLLSARLPITKKTRKEGFTDCSVMTLNGQEIMECGPDSNVQGRLFFRDKSKSTAYNEDNNTDPYYLEKVQNGANDSHLRLTLNDDANESLQIWGNSCSTGDCAGPGRKAHHLRADGAAAHLGSLVIGDDATPIPEKPGWGGFNFGLSVLNPVIGQWSHFPWADGVNYIRGKTQFDADTNVDGNVNVASKFCIGGTCITEGSLKAYSGLQAQMTSQISGSVSGLQAQIDALQNRINQINATDSNQQNQLTQINSTDVSLQNQLNSFSATDRSLQTQLNSINV